MRVAIDGSAFGSDRGGDETSLRGIVEGVAVVAGAEDCFFLHTNDPAATPASVRDDDRFSLRDLRSAGRVRRLASTLPRAASADACDVLFGLTHVPFTNRLARMLLVADVSFVRHPEHYPAVVRYRLTHLVRRQVHRVAVIATVSEFSRSELIDVYSLDPDRVVVVPNPVDPPPGGSRTGADPSASEDVVASLAARGVRPPYVLYLGNLHPRKNVPRLVAAFEQARRDPALAGHTLVIAGGTWWGDVASTERARAARDVVMLGRVSFDEREYLLSNALMLAYPSLYEGFGLPPLEAMARGTPVVAADAGSIPETTGGAAVLVDPLSVDAIAAGMVTLASCADQREALVDAGRVRAASFTLERTGDAAFAGLRLACEIGSTRPASRTRRGHRTSVKSHSEG